MMKEYEIIREISGLDTYGKPKAAASIYHEYIGSDGSNKEVDSIYIQKPEIRLFKDYNNMVRIDFIYEFSDDVDLLQQYMFLEKFFHPENSVDFTEDDLDNLDEQVLYLNTLVINIISLSPRGKYTVTTTEKPLFYQLVPVRPADPPTILRMTFHVDDVIIEELSEEVAKRNLEEGIYND